MTRIVRLRRGSRNVRVHPTTTEAQYQLVTGEDCRPYFQLSTFGSPDRKEVGTSSQTIQVDEEMARELVEAIRTVFPRV
jgi:hypothetical protein